MKRKKLMPELFDDDEIDEIVSYIYNDCLATGCDDCRYKGELDDEVCKCDIIMELWRKWKNVKCGGLEEYVLP